MKRLRVLAVSGGVVAALALPGCGTPQAGAAAVVGDRRITVSEVQEAYRDVSVLTGADAQLSQSDVLNWLILGPMVIDAARDQNVGVSETDARLQFAEVEDRLPEPSDAALQVVQTAVALSRLQSGEVQPEQVDAVFQGIIEQLQSETIEINPRYGGSYDLTRLVVEPGSSNWLRQDAQQQVVPDGQQQDGQQQDGGTEGGGTEGGTAPTP